MIVSTRIKVVATLALAVILGVISVMVVRAQYVDSLLVRLETMSTMLNADHVKSLKVNDEAADSNEARLKAQLHAARGVNDQARFLYLMDTSSTGDVYFLVDSEPVDSDDYSARGEAFPEASEALKSSFYNSQSFVEGPIKDRWGSWLSAIVPVFDEQKQQIAIIGMDVPAGTYYSLLSVAAAFPLLGGILLALLFVLFDRLRRKRQEVIRLRSELVSIASHELRTPLTGIRWGTESLIGQKLTHKQHQTVSSIYDSTIRLQESIEDILQLANSQAGRNLTLVKTTTDMTRLIEGVFAVQKLPAAQKNVSLEFRPGWPKQLMIDCDTQRMKRVVNNLVSNAVKYTGPGTVVRIGYERVDQFHVFSIHDQGIGIPADEQEKVFEGFYRASNARQAEASGTGMGLFMSRATIDQHGGKLWLESKQDKGTTVYFRLP
jgi:signal transduction histidine kinase